MRRNACSLRSCDNISEAKSCDPSSRISAAFSRFSYCHAWRSRDWTDMLQPVLQVWTSRMLFFFSSYKVRLPYSVLFPTLFTHPLPGEMREAVWKNINATCVRACLHRMPTDGNILSLLHNPETLHLRSREHEESALWCDTCHRSFTPR